MNFVKGILFVLAIVFCSSSFASVRNDDRLDVINDGECVTIADNERGDVDILFCPTKNGPDCLITNKGGLDCILPNNFRFDIGDIRDNFCLEQIRFNRQRDRLDKCAIGRGNRKIICIVTSQGEISC